MKIKLLVLLCLFSSCSVISDVFVQSVAGKIFALETQEEDVHSEYTVTFDDKGDYKFYMYQSWSNSTGGGYHKGSSELELIKTISDTVGMYRLSSKKYRKVEIADNNIIMYVLSDGKDEAIAQDEIYLILIKE